VVAVVVVVTVQVVPQERAAVELGKQHLQEQLPHLTLVVAVAEAVHQAVTAVLELL
jgi:hypothetical protein